SIERLVSDESKKARNLSHFVYELFGYPILIYNSHFRDITASTPLSREYPRLDQSGLDKHLQLSPMRPTIPRLTIDMTPRNLQHINNIHQCPPATMVQSQSLHVIVLPELLRQQF